MNTQYTKQVAILWTTVFGVFTAILYILPIEQLFPLHGLMLATISMGLSSLYLHLQKKETTSSITLLIVTLVSFLLTFTMLLLII